MEHGNAAHALQGVEEKMRVDLIAQGIQIAFPLHKLVSVGLLLVFQHLLGQGRNVFQHPVDALHQGIQLNAVTAGNTLFLRVPANFVYFGDQRPDGVCNQAVEQQPHGDEQQHHHSCGEQAAGLEKCEILRHLRIIDAAHHPESRVLKLVLNIGVPFRGLRQLGICVGGDDHVVRPQKI